ncbi:MULTISPECIES: SDR family NAD(P)-dependent oxidoreductase [unclassified Mycobacterium]|uniref:SDR family NAD(P)-dependent oxidoreductase n=1 Tax=unclassified Mycobacterium TaxID=2642494 RepID=UPI0029C7A33B|nr:MULTISPECIES: SDR family NAD(P)-dependent oxidoreductase [unclassified Mycobacterium]
MTIHPMRSRDESPGRAAVVTGGSSAIGCATAKRLARAGYLVVLGARRVEVCEVVAAELQAEGATAFAVPLELADIASIDSFVRAVGYLVGAVDALVFNAGRSWPGDSSGMDAAAMRDDFDTNALGAQHLAAKLMPAMTEKGSGDVVFVSCEVAVSGMAASSASTAALETWSAMLQAELEGTGVRVSIVRTGMTMTEDPSATGLRGMLMAWPPKNALRERNPVDLDDISRAVATVIDRPNRGALRAVEANERIGAVL